MPGTLRIAGCASHFEGRAMCQALCGSRDVPGTLRSHLSCVLAPNLASLASPRQWSSRDCGRTALTNHHALFEHEFRDFWRQPVARPEDRCILTNTEQKFGPQLGRECSPNTPCKQTARCGVAWRDGCKVALVCGNWPCKRAQLRDQCVINA